MWLSYRSIDAVWESSRRKGVLKRLYCERVDDWGLLKCARVYAKQAGIVRNARLVRLLLQIFAWVRARTNEAYRNARSALRVLV
jgi:hypothetical protein